jgi:hypothetical protein
VAYEVTRAFQPGKTRKLLRPFGLVCSVFVSCQCHGGAVLARQLPLGETVKAEVPNTGPPCSGSRGIVPSRPRTNFAGLPGGSRTGGGRCGGIRLCLDCPSKTRFGHCPFSFSQEPPPRNTCLHPSALTFDARRGFPPLNPSPLLLARARGASGVV